MKKQFVALNIDTLMLINTDDTPFNSSHVPLLSKSGQSLTGQDLINHPEQRRLTMMNLEEMPATKDDFVALVTSMAERFWADRQRWIDFTKEK